MTLTFEPTDGPGLEVFDPIERHQYSMGTSEPVTPAGVGTEAFDVPVDDAVSITTEHVELPSSVAVYAHDTDGTVVAEAGNGAAVSLPPGTYSIELTTEVKTYLRVDAAVEMTDVGDRKRIDFGEPTTVLVGARSRHEHPAATITTTTDIDDVMRAVSILGSALKTTAPERSFPTLRGHPPLIELGEEVDAPPSLERPDTGLRLELPPSYRHVYVAAPLAYYLGAEVVRGDRPRLVADTGFVYPLDGPEGYERTVERTLKQVFLFDCVLRTEGRYDMRLHEREAIEREVDLDFADLYDRPLTAQVAAYLSVPFETVEPHLPEWKLTSHVEPTPDGVEMLPFLVNDLAVIRSPERREAPVPASEVSAINDFLRDGDEFTRSASADGGVVADALPGETVGPTRADSLEQAWVGEGVPLGTSKPTARAYRNRLDREPADGDIDITVVCNDSAMHEEEDLVREVYDERDELPFDVTVHDGLTKQELRDVLAEPVEFLHYIGHIDDDGFECADGRLDATTLERVGVDAFFLNACKSYEQGMALIDAGSIGGVVTLREVVNSGAVAVGCTLARLLNRGFPLRAGLTIASGESVVGRQYVVVGDGGLAIAQPESGTPYTCEVERDGGSYVISITGYPARQRGMGAMFLPHIGTNETYFLNSGTVEEFRLSKRELTAFLSLEDVPVKIGSDLFWSWDLDLDDL